MNAYIIDDIFLSMYPNELEDEAFVEMGKKYRSSDRVLKMASEFDLSSLKNVDSISINKNIALITKMVTTVPMVSTFEKIAFKNYIADYKVQPIFLESLYKLLKKNNEKNFEDFVYTLSLKKNEKNSNPAKWPVITFFLTYFNPHNEVFVKPTTTKKIAKLLEVDINYQALPNYDTYSRIRKMVLDYKKDSRICKKENNIIVQAVMFTALNIGEIL